MVRDEELKRLVKYAQGLNISVSIRPDFADNDAAGSCTLDGREIVIYRLEGMSKIELVLTMIHETGHALFNIHTNERTPDPKLEAALEAEDEKKRHRKIIYEHEKASADWWDIIYKETEMQFPFYILERQRAFDLWQYEMWVEDGR